MKLKIIIIAGCLVILTMVCLVFYAVQFEFYEELKAKRMVDLCLMPSIGIGILGYTVLKIRKKEVNQTFFKELFFAIFGGGLLYYFMLRNVFCFGLLFINATFGKHETVHIQGMVTKVVQIHGSGKVIGKYELTINQNGTLFIFESKKVPIEKYAKNQNITLEMKKGVLNILYR